MMNKKFFNSAFFVALAALFLMPTVALASFPDFGPFETQTRYLEASFGIAENFFRQAAGLGTNNTLQYLCLTAALVGSVLVVLRKKNQALGTLIPWLILVFIMLAGPYNSKFLFVKALNDEVATKGMLDLPSGFSDAGQKGFAPQIISIHVMSTLHRLFYDFFSEKNIGNMVEVMETRQGLQNTPGLKISPDAYANMQSAAPCSLGSDGAVADPSVYSNVTTLADAVDKIKSYTADSTERPPVAAMFTSYSQLPDSIKNDKTQLIKYATTLNSVAEQLGVSPLPLTPTDVASTSSMRTWFEGNLSGLTSAIYGSISAETISPQNLSYYVVPMATSGGVDTSSATIQKRLTNVHTNKNEKDPSCKSGGAGCRKRTGYASEFLDNPGTLYSNLIAAGAGDLPVAQVEIRKTTDGSDLEVAVPESCTDKRNSAVSSAFTSIGSNVGYAPELTNLLKSGATITRSQMEAFLKTSKGPGHTIKSYNDSTQKAAKYYLAMLNNSGYTEAEASAALRNSILDVASANSERDLAAAGMEVGTRGVGGTGAAIVNGVAHQLVGLAKPVIQLLSPFILAFAVIVVEMMKVVIDIALAGIIIVTPLAFMMGLLIPSYALGVMTLATLCVLILKMAPLTFTIIDAIVSIMYKMLDAAKPSFLDIVEADGLISAIFQKGLNLLVPTFEQTLLMFAAAGMYTSVVGLSLFILFKIGDPSSVAQLSSIDGAAQKLGKAAVAIGAAAAGAAVVGGTGAFGAAKGHGLRAAAGKAAAEGLSSAKEKGLAQAQAAVASLPENASSDLIASTRQSAFQSAFSEELGFTPDKDNFNSETGEFLGMNESEAYKMASDGLDMEDHNAGIFSNGALSNMALTGIKEGGEVLTSAASSMLPGGGAGLMKQIGNARREGQARAEARISSRNQGKSLYTSGLESDIQGYRGQFSGILAGSAAYSGVEGAGGGSGAVSSAMMSSAISGGQQQAGQEIAGMWASAEIHGIEGLSAKDYQIAASLNARQSEAQVAEAAAKSLEVSSNAIQAEAAFKMNESIRAYDAESLKYYAAKEAIANDVNNTNRDVLEAKAQAEINEIDANVKAQLDSMDSEDFQVQARALLEQEGVTGNKPITDADVDAKANLLLAEYKNALIAEEIDTRAQLKRAELSSDSARSELHMNMQKAELEKVSGGVQLSNEGIDAEINARVSNYKAQLENEVIEANSSEIKVKTEAERLRLSSGRESIKAELEKSALSTEGNLSRSPMSNVITEEQVDAEINRRVTAFENNLKSEVISNAKLDSQVNNKHSELNSDLSKLQIATTQMGGKLVSDAMVSAETTNQVLEFKDNLRTQFRNSSNLTSEMTAKLQAKQAEIFSDTSKTNIRANLESIERTKANLSGATVGKVVSKDEMKEFIADRKMRIQTEAEHKKASIEANKISKIEAAKLRGSDITDDQLLEKQRKAVIHKAYEEGAEIAYRYKTEAKYQRQDKTHVDKDGKIKWGGASLEQHYIQAEMDSAPGVSKFMKNYASTVKINKMLKDGTFNFDNYNIQDSDKITAKFIAQEAEGKLHVENPNNLTLASRVQGERAYRATVAKAKEFGQGPERDLDLAIKDQKTVLKRQAQAIHKKWPVEVEINTGAGARGVADSYISSITNETRSILQDKYMQDSKGKHFDVPIADLGAMKVATDVGLKLYENHKGQSVKLTDKQSFTLDKPGNMVLMRDANIDIYDAAFNKMKENYSWPEDMRGRPIQTLDLFNVDLKSELQKPEYRQLIDKAYAEALDAEEDLRGSKYSSKILSDKYNREGNS